MNHVLFQLVNLIPLLSCWFMLFKYMPQIARCIRRKSSEDISLVSAATPLIDNILSIIYGLCFATWTYVAACSLALVLSTAMFIVAIYYRHRLNSQAQAFCGQTIEGDDINIDNLV